MVKQNVSLIYPPGWDSIVPPFGISCLKGFLSGHGFNLKCFDFSIELGGKFFDGSKDQLDRCIKMVLDEGPDVVGLTLLDPNFKNFLYMAERIKDESKDTKIVIGGPQTSYVGDEILKNYDFVDIAIAGEGERGFLKILEDESFADELKKSRRPYCSPWISDIDSIPFPNFDDFDLDKYPVKMLPVFGGARGCKKKCTFCGLIGNHVFGPYRERSPENVILEIKNDIETYDVTNFLFMDALMNVNPESIEKICDQILELDADIKWGAEVFPDMDEGLIDKMYESGCRFLWISPETGSPRTAKRMRKDIDVEIAEKTIKATGKKGIFVSSWLILGFPGEDEDDIRYSIEFAKNVKDYSGELLFVPFTLMKGSHVYNHPTEYKINSINRDPCSIWSQYESENSIPELDIVRLTISLWEDFNDLGLGYPFFEDYTDEEVRYILGSLEPEKRKEVERDIEKTRNKKPYSYGEIFKEVFGD